MIVFVFIRVDMPKSLMISFLKRLRDDHQLPQKEMARIMGVSHRTYQRIESGESELTASQFLNTIKLFQKDFILTYFKLFKSKKKKDGENRHRNMENILNDNHQINFLDKSLIGESLYPDLNKETYYKTCCKEEGVKIGYWEYSVSERYIYWTDEMYDIYGLKKGSSIFNKNIGERIYPEDIPSFNQAFYNFIKFNIPISGQHRVKLDEYHYYLVSVTSEVIEVEGMTYLAGVSKAYLLRAT